MSAYELSLIAAGTSPEHAAFLAQREALYRLENREHPNYGQKEEDDE